VLSVAKDEVRSGGQRKAAGPISEAISANTGNGVPEKSRPTKARRWDAGIMAEAGLNLIVLTR
jgi:hypothetical protein